MVLFWLSIGFLVGVVVAAVLTGTMVHRSHARVLAAQKRARRAERLAEIGSMTGGLAHEIKNPLSTIGLNAQLLSESIEDLVLDEQDRGRLLRRTRALRHETERLRGILEDFLEFAGELRLAITRVDLNAMISELADFYEPQAASSGVQLRVDLCGQSPIVEIDGAHMKQAILNLMLNAVNAMDTDGNDPRELILRTLCAHDPVTKEPVVRIHVIDTGPGMNEQTRDRVFHPYFTTRSSGTGLGLSIARRIVDAHNGHIDLHTEIGVGSDFAIVLPNAGPRSGG